jgi:hypothetical protein
MRPVALSDGRFTYEAKQMSAINTLFQPVLSRMEELLGKDQEPETPLHEEGDTMDLEKLMKQLADLSEEQREEVLAALLPEGENGKTPASLEAYVEAQLSDVDSRVSDLVNQQVEAKLAEKETVDLAKSLVGGGDLGQGLPVEREKLEGFLLSLNPKQRKEAGEILTEVQKSGLVDFTEHGSGARREGGKKQFSDEMISVIDGQIARGVSLEAFFEANDDLDPGDYDLSRWEEKEDGEEE